jgi:hypothetical protein
LLRKALIQAGKTLYMPKTLGEIPAKLV